MAVDQEEDVVQKDEAQKVHPIYNLTNFPEYKLPELGDSDKALAEQPVWMKKGKRIITDIPPALKRKALSENAKSSLDSLKLDQRIMRALAKEGYTSWFPVQINIIPAVVRGSIQKRDIAVCAPTGSGKTLAYALPICHVCYVLILRCVYRGMTPEGILK